MRASSRNPLQHHQRTPHKKKALSIVFSLVPFSPCLPFHTPPFFSFVFRVRFAAMFFHIFFAYKPTHRQMVEVEGPIAPLHAIPYPRVGGVDFDGDVLCRDTHVVQLHLRNVAVDIMEERIRGSQPVKERIDPSCIQNVGNCLVKFPSYI